METIAKEYEHVCNFNEDAMQTVVCMNCASKKIRVKRRSDEICDCDRFDLLMEYKCGNCEMIKKELHRLEGEIRLKFNAAAEHAIVNMEMMNNFQIDIEKINHRRLQLKNTLIYQKLKRSSVVAAASSKA